MRPVISDNMQDVINGLSFTRISKGGNEGVEINVQALSGLEVTTLENQLASLGMHGRLTTSSVQNGDQVMRFFDPSSIEKVAATFPESSASHLRMR